MAMGTALFVAGCSPPQSSVPQPVSMNWQSVLDVERAVAMASQYEAASIEVTRNQYHVAVSIARPTGDTTAVADLQSESAIIATAVEKSLTDLKELESIQGISVAYVHLHAESHRHTDDVFEFRKGPGGSFQLHTT